MINEFKDLKKRFVKLDDIWIDNNVFRLHYKGTFLVFMVACVLVTFNQYFGDPIDCIVEDKSLEKVMDSYCWIQSTFSVPSRWPNEFGDEFAHPGVRPQYGEYGYSRYPGMNYRNEQPEKKEHKYYQWVCFVLFFQAFITYIPRHLWKIWEGKRIQLLVEKLASQPMLPLEEKEEQVDMIVEYFQRQRGKRDLAYTVKFFLLEIANLVNIIFQFFFINWFLKYEFTTYGFLEVLKMTELEPEYRPDPMAKIFPKVTKCTFRKYGPSGTIQKHDSLCVLPLNIINEKVYIFLWAWLTLAGAVTISFLVYRAILLLSSPLRCQRISSRGTKKTKDKDVKQILGHDSPSYVSEISDWFLLNLICKNLHPLTVDQLIMKLKNTNGTNERYEDKKHLPLYTKNDSGLGSQFPSVDNSKYDETMFLNANNHSTLQTNISETS